MNELSRECYKCKNEIAINIDNIKGIIYYKNYYYHKDCFIEQATKLSEKNIKTRDEWKYALEHVDALEKEASRRLWHFFWRNQINDWVIDHYNISFVPKKFFTAIEDLDDGKYRGKRCKPISMQTLYEAWKWGQNNLDKINANNKKNNKGPASDNERLMYDLAIIINKVPNYLSHKSKNQEAKADMASGAIYDEIDMSRIGQSKQINRKDISDISNDIFVE